MNCLSIGSGNFADLKEILRTRELVELRLDLLDNFEPLEELLDLPAKVIITFRPGKISPEARRKIFRRCIAKSVWAIDLEIESEEVELVKEAKAKGTLVVVSYHNYQLTPSRDELEEIVTEAISKGADIVKIACAVREKRDSARLLGLLDRKQRLVVLGMESQGKLTRIVAPLLGSEWSYVSLGKDLTTASGQLSEENVRLVQQELKKALSNG